MSPAPGPVPTAPPMMMAPAAEKTAMPVAGGALVLIAGILGLGQGAVLFLPGAALAGIPGGESLAAILAICGGIFVIFGLVAIVGGIMAVQRKMWGLALVGSILGLLALGFILGSVLSLVGLILIAISKKEFA